METNENEGTSYQNIWDRMKTVHRGKFTVIQEQFKAQNMSPQNLTSHLRDLEKQEQKKPRKSRRSEVTKLRAEINSIK